MKGLSKGRYDETFAGEDAWITLFSKSINLVSAGQGLIIGHICRRYSATGPK